METKLERIASKSANTKRPEFTSLYHLINKELLMQCHKEADGNKAVGIDEITKREYSENLEGNIHVTSDASTCFIVQIPTKNIQKENY